MMRLVATTLCLLYLSVSTVLAAVHHHDGSFDDQHCAACSWHHDGTVDEPAVPPVIIPPEFLVFPETPLGISFQELSLRIHPSRGPPLSKL